MEKIKVHKGPKNGTTEQKTSIWDRKEVQFVIGVGGVYLTYIYYGVLQEKLFSKDYTGNPKKKFSFSFAIVLFQSILSYFIATAVLRFHYKTSPSQTLIPRNLQVKMGGFNLLSMLTSNSALMYVSYPVQALIKSCKILSVLIVGLIIGGKKFTKTQYIYVTLITSGILIFNLMQDTKKGKKESTTSILGLVLCFVSLTSDGLLADTQDTISKAHKPSSYDMMAANSKWAAILCLGYSFLSLQLISFVEFVWMYPSVLPDLIVISVMGAVGQNFIYYVITSFSTLLLSIVTTTRKFFTVLISIVIYDHSINKYQWLSIVLVFLGVGIDFVEGLKHKMKKKPQTEVKYTELPTPDTPTEVSSVENGESYDKHNGKLINQKIVRA